MRNKMLTISSVLILMSLQSSWADDVIFAHTKEGVSGTGEKHFGSTRMEASGRKDKKTKRIGPSQKNADYSEETRDEKEAVKPHFLDSKEQRRVMNFYAAKNAGQLNDIVKRFGTLSVTCNFYDDTKGSYYDQDGKLQPQIVTETSNKKFKPGCEVLKEDPKNKTKLAQCFNSIQIAITRGARNSSGIIVRDKLFCNLYKNLRPEEQHFAGLMFTSIGEAGIIIKSSKTAAPKFQEQLFVMQTMDNRVKAARKDKGEKINGLDVALAYKQFSMYNSKIFPDFRKYFEPGNRSHQKDIRNGISAFIQLQEGEGLSPKEGTPDIGMYYNPHGMAKTSNPAARARVRRLKREGKIPASHPYDRAAPTWDFSKLTPITNLSYKGVPVKKTAPYMHVFYAHKNKKPFYGAPSKMPPESRKECAK